MDMNLDRKKIVVCGATGNQGGAVMRSLLTYPNIAVVALTRQPGSEKARQLAESGAIIGYADLMDEASLKAAFDGADGVFGVTQPWSSDYKKCDTVAEVQQGKNIIAACQQAGVGHLVFSSVLNISNQPMGVAHADSKLELEKLVEASSIAYTILRCSQFMDNIGSAFFPVKNGVISGFVDADAKVPYLACADIGNVAVKVFNDPAVYHKLTLDLIGDFISGADLAQMLSSINPGRRFTYKAAPKLLMWAFAREFFTMRRLFEKTGRVPYPDAIGQALQSRLATTSMKDHLMLNTTILN
jgi:uncharacterized protein YbjT (DUF2867 family)